MFVDASKLDDGTSATCGICIIGAGVAGLSLALRLERNADLDILLIESGGLQDDREFDDLSAGESNLGDYPFKETRARAFGGTTRRWTGACIPLDPVDFEPRSWLAHSGWPIRYDDLASYYEDAGEIFGLSDAGALRDRLQDTPLHGRGLAAQVVQYSTPLDLGAKYQARIGKSEKVTCWLHASARHLAVDETGQRIETIWLRTPAGTSLAVRPRAVVLAAGGLENPRLLLLSKDRCEKGLGNGNDLVGRYHMEHPIRSLAILPIGAGKESFLPYTNRIRLSRSTAQGTFGLSGALRNAEGLLDMHFRLYRYNALEDHPAVIDAKRLVAGQPVRPGRSTLSRLAQLGTSSVSIARYLGWHLANKTCRLAPFDHVRMTAFVEQEPDPENRVTLGTQRDRHGSLLPCLRYRESGFMTDSQQRSLERLAQLLAERGFPGLRFRFEDAGHLGLYDKYGLHQMGATRMAETPARGVVDRDCRVFGLSNLFVAGSSVFATGGAANPTLTISALALRLADHLTGLGLRKAQDAG